MKDLLLEYIPFSISKNEVNESLSKNSGKLLVSGVLQRAGAKNQNGRVYPREILKREANKYNEEFVKQRRALGETDHPNCVSSTAEVMTTNGWKFLKDLDGNETVFTLNRFTNQIEPQSINKVIKEPYKGKMITLKGMNINTMVTPNHKFLVTNRKGENIFITAQEILDLSKKIRVTHLMIPTNSPNIQFEQEEFTNIELEFDNIQVEEVDFDDTVYCVNVDNETFYCRDNNKSFWSGNSSVVNLANASHHITKMWWEGDDLMGEVEILSTPSGNILMSLLNAGITLGISSRGVGSVKEVFNESDNQKYAEVQEDFELIAFDFVSNPSTHGAYMIPIKESVDKNGGKDKKLNELISNIICDIQGVCNCN